MVKLNFKTKLIMLHLLTHRLLECRYHLPLEMLPSWPVSPSGLRPGGHRLISVPVVQYYVQILLGEKLNPFISVTPLFVI